MKYCNYIGKLLLTTAVALAASTVTLRVQAQDQIVDSFDTDTTVTAWSATWGTTPTLSFSANNSDKSLGAAGSGSLSVASAFTASTSYQQAVTLRTLTNAIKTSQYETVSVDVRVDPSSVPTSGGQYGYFEIKHGSGGTSLGGANLTSTNWTTLTWNVPAATADITEIRIQLGSSAFAGPVTYEMDNFKFNAPRTVIQRFDDTTEVDVWTPTWGTAPVLAFDAADAGGSTNPASGSLKVTADYFTPADDGWEQAVIQHQNFDPAIPMADHVAVSVDVRVDPSSVPTAANQFGYFELKHGSGGVAFGGVNLSSTNWTTITWNVAAGTADIVELRIQNGNGGFQGPVTYYLDNWVFVKRVGGPVMSILTAPQDDVKRDAVVLNWLLNAGADPININSVLLSIDGQVAAAAKVTVTNTPTGANVLFDDTGTVWTAGEHSWSLTFSDTGTPAKNVTGQGVFIVNPYPTEGTFVIEAEDFNYDSGKANPMKGVADMDVDVMPYLGGAYDTLSADAGVDYAGDDGNDSDLYRTELDATGQNAVNIANNLGGRYGADRGTFDVTINYRLGWVANGEWHNYTRTFPNTNYHVWAALSRDGRDANLISASLDLVTSTATTTNQTVQRLGAFSGSGSGGWGRNTLVPMKQDGAFSVVAMSGPQTLRFNVGGGDFDYLLFVPTSDPLPAPVITGATITAGNITVTWTGGGTLWRASSPTGSWTTTSDSDGSFTTSAATGQEYFRVIRP